MIDPIVQDSNPGPPARGGWQTERQDFLQISNFDTL